MLVGVASLPSFIPALQNIGILHHKKEKLHILLQQSVPLVYTTCQLQGPLLTEAIWICP